MLTELRTDTTSERFEAQITKGFPDSVKSKSTHVCSNMDNFETQKNFQILVKYKRNLNKEKVSKKKTKKTKKS